MTLSLLPQTLHVAANTLGVTLTSSIVANTGKLRCEMSLTTFLLLYFTSFGSLYSRSRASQVVLVVRNKCRRCKGRGFDPWVGKVPWRRAWQSTPVLLPGESQGQRSVAGYSPQSLIEADMTEAT